jgi:RimJ/RimL family protein N-acetyltransferase
MSAEQAANLVAARMADNPERTSTAFAIVDNAGRLLGSVSLLWIDWEKSVGEVAYWISADSRGKGVGQRAVGALCEWAFDTLGLQRLQLTADVRNEPSRRLAERVGFQRERLVRASRIIHGQPIDEYLYTLLPSRQR